MGLFYSVSVTTDKYCKCINGSCQVQAHLSAPPCEDFKYVDLNEEDSSGPPL